MTSRSSTALPRSMARLYSLHRPRQVSISLHGSLHSRFSLPLCSEPSCSYGTGQWAESKALKPQTRLRWTHSVNVFAVKPAAKGVTSHDRDTGFGAWLPHGDRPLSVHLLARECLRQSASKDAARLPAGT